MSLLVNPFVAVLVIDPWLLVGVVVLSIVVACMLMEYPPAGFVAVAIIIACIAIFVVVALSHKVFGWPSVHFHFLQIKEMHDTPIKITLNALRSNT